MVTAGPLRGWFGAAKKKHFTIPPDRSANLIPRHVICAPFAGVAGHDANGLIHAPQITIKYRPCTFAHLRNAVTRAYKGSAVMAFRSCSGTPEKGKGNRLMVITPPVESPPPPIRFRAGQRTRLRRSRTASWRSAGRTSRGGDSDEDVCTFRSFPPSAASYALRRSPVGEPEWLPTADDTYRNRKRGFLRIGPPTPALGMLYGLLDVPDVARCALVVGRHIAPPCHHPLRPAPAAQFQRCALKRRNGAGATATTPAAGVPAAARRGPTMVVVQLNQG
eukprot:gene16006-biopygen12709